MVTEFTGSDASSAHLNLLPDFVTPENVACVPSPNSDELLAQLAQYEPILLTQMQSVALLKRVEVKYVLPSALLPSILQALSPRYFVLKVAGHRLNRYRTLYFDTHDFAMYRRHHAGAADRFKVRSRTYVESGISFLEIKHKTNKKRVIKNRIQTPDLVTEFDNHYASFVDNAAPYSVDEMQPRLWNSYQRITLVDKGLQERVTLDVGLRFHWQGRSVVLPHVAVAEVKQERLSQGSDFVRLMRQRHMRSTGFSKYCIGASLLYPQLKRNRFKKKHRLLAKLASDERATGGYRELY